MTSVQTNPMTTAELTAAINAGEFTVTVLPARKPRKADLIMSRVGGAKSRFYAATGSGRNGREQEQRQRLAGVAAH
jgi:hypothetical protein